jgi:NADPH:quinone reductase-like Zn-dependent oxidoreductase
VSPFDLVRIRALRCPVEKRTWTSPTSINANTQRFAAETIGAANKAILGYLNEGALNPKVGKVFPLTEAAEAVRYLVENRPYGRIIMQVPHPAHAE